MKRVIYPNDIAEITLSDGWQMLMTPAGAFVDPVAIKDRTDATAAPVPGTLAQALMDAGRYDPSKPHHLHDQDAWYFNNIETEYAGRAVLRFEGLASISDVYLNGALIQHVQSMFLETNVEVSLSGYDELAICFRALDPHLNSPRKRARWRSAMMSHQGLRYLRTTALGYMPGWCPEIQAVGPYRPITLITDNRPLVSEISVRTEFDPCGGGALYFEAEFSSTFTSAKLHCAGHETDIELTADSKRFAKLQLSEISPWWPNSHGAATLYDVDLIIDGQRHDLGKTGFRHIEAHQGKDGQGFGLRINGHPIFCRGAVWSSADLIRLSSSRETYEPILRRAAEAGMNMLRIAGTGVYEGGAFFELCDELGIMVWQDLMLANFDYPAHDESFMSLLGAEVDQLLLRHRHNPSLIVLCGGSEMQQQAAMFGLSAEKRTMPELDSLLATHAQALRPDLITVPNSPFGGALPFQPNRGVAHYFGVGAYRQPLSDARRAHVSFASECLALSHIPEDDALPTRESKTEAWLSLIPSDRGADWNFEDIRDHYMHLLYGADAEGLRNSDVERYIALSRATSAELATELYSEFRRNGSSCNGALMLMLQDLYPSCGWGLLDSEGLPKSPYLAAKRIFRPIGISITDEATNGLDIHLWNESSRGTDCRIELNCIKDGSVKVLSVSKDILLSPRSSQQISAYELIGAFFDVNHAYRFGPASHEVTHMRLTDNATNLTLGDAFHFPLGRQAALFDAKLEIKKHEDHSMTIAASQFAQSVHITCPGFCPADNYFHMAAGEEKKVMLAPVTASNRQLTGFVTHLGCAEKLYF